jgi:methionyl-tRNA synthetase
MDAATRVNQYIDAQKPWVLAKDPQSVNLVQGICTMGLNLFRILMTYLKPVLPQMAIKAEYFLNCPLLQWASIDEPLLDHSIKPFAPLLTRVEQANIDALLNHQER